MSPPTRGITNAPPAVDTAASDVGADGDDVIVSPPPLLLVRFPPNRATKLDVGDASITAASNHENIAVILQVPNAGGR